MIPTVYTIGHSSHPIGHFIDLLRANEITAVADVRSMPYSRMNPQFNRESLLGALANAGIQYVHLGDQLGARSTDDTTYVNGKVSYSRLAATDSFRFGVERIIDGMKKFTIALMCAEKDPLDCHRTILISRFFNERMNVSVAHILSDGAKETQSQSLERLIEKFGFSKDLFISWEEMINRAYELQENRIAYKRDEENPIHTYWSA